MFSLNYQLNLLDISLIRKEIEEDLLNEYSVFFIASSLLQNLVLTKISVNNNAGFLEMNIINYALIYY